MNVKSEQVVAALAERFPDIVFAPAALALKKRPEDEQTCILVPADRLIEVAEFLYDDPRCRFEQLCDLTCVDYLNYPGARDRYGVTYSLLSLSLEQRIWAKCFVNDPDPRVPSVTGIWSGAEWMEREVYDLFGVRFTGHPDLRRIMTWEGFKAHPLRKDYPLRGRGEREDFDIVTTESA